MKRLSDEDLRRLLLHVHVHDDYCYGMYRPCGEHHAHDDSCGARPLICHKREEPEAPVVFAAIAELLRRRAEDPTDEERLALRGCSVHCANEDQLRLATAAIGRLVVGRIVG